MEECILCKRPLTLLKHTLLSIQEQNWIYMDLYWNCLDYQPHNPPNPPQSFLYKENTVPGAEINDLGLLFSNYLPTPRSN